MQLAGSSSWRFEEDSPQFLHLALFVRDATGLPTPSLADIPPALASEIPTLTNVLRISERGTAATQWVTWWRKLIENEATEVKLRRNAAEQSRAHQERFARVTRREQLFDPPRFESLASMPALQSAVATIFDDGVKWVNRLGSNGLQEPENATLFPWAATRSAAAKVATTQGIPVGNLDATLHVLDVHGSWIHLAAPGYALCSKALQNDPLVANRLLYDVFASCSK